LPCAFNTVLRDVLRGVSPRHCAGLASDNLVVGVLWVKDIGLIVRPGFLLSIMSGLLCALLSSNAQAIASRQSDPELEPLLRRAIAEHKDCFLDRFDRQVWFTTMEPKLQKTVSDIDERRLILEHVYCQSKRLELPAGLVMAVIDIESRFDRWAVSHAGAVGLMQVMPFWPRQLGMTNDQLVRIPDNIRMGCTILKYYIDREDGNYTRALARYNGSTGRREYSDKVLNRLAKQWQFK
jgi:soluble lytic murein transglycosylase-like protein